MVKVLRCRFCGVTCDEKHEEDCGHNPRPPKDLSILQPDDCRAQFEAWILTAYPDLAAHIARKFSAIGGERYINASLNNFWSGWLGCWNTRLEREIVAPPPEMGMKMADVRVGMRMKSLYGGPVITVTEITEKGFKYAHPPYHLGGRIGQTTGGEHYGYNGYSHYTPVSDDDQGRRGSDA